VRAVFAIVLAILCVLYILDNVLFLRRIYIIGIFAQEFERAMCQWSKHYINISTRTPLHRYFVLHFEW